MTWWKILTIAIGLAVLGIALFKAIMILVHVVSIIILVLLCLIPAAIVYGIYRLIKWFRK